MRRIDSPGIDTIFKSPVPDLASMFAVLPGLILACTAFAQVPGLDDETVLQRLSTGGLVIVFRHGPTNREQRDSLQLADAGDISEGQRQSAFFDCSRQRLLSKAGRDELIRMGEAIRSLELAIDDVHASPMCRTRETAWLVFGRVTPNTALVSRQAVEERRKLAGSPPAAGTNRVLITHGQLVTGLLAAATNPTEEAIPEGGAFLLEPLGDNEYRILARMLPEDWQNLADLSR